MSEWGGDRLREDARWTFGIPPKGNANYAWLQHIHHHLAPNGMAGVVLANGSMSSTTSDEDTARVAEKFHSWRGVPSAVPYEDEPGFCQSVTLEKIRECHYILTPGRYVGAAATEGDNMPFEEWFMELRETLAEQFAEAVELNTIIEAKLREIVL